MKIARIALKDFRAYHDAEIQFDEPLSIIRGLNHSGKTTIKQAIELVLAKRTEGTTAAGAGADDKIRQGAKKAQIDLNLTTRRGPVEVQMIQRPGSRNYSAPPGFDDYLAQNSTRFSCVLDPTYFVLQPEKEQKAILSALIAPTEYEFDPGIMKLADKYLEMVGGGDPVTVIDNYYSKAFALRREAKALLDAIRVPQPVAPPDYTVEQIQQYLNKLRDELAAEAQPDTTEVRNNAGQIATLEERLKQKETRLQEQQTVRAQAQEAQKEAEADMLTGPQFTKHKKVADHRKRFDEIQADITSNRSRKRTIEEAIKEVRELVAEGSGECPTCHQALTDESVEAAIDALQSTLRGLETQHTEYLEVQKGFGDIAAAEKALAEHEAAKQKKLDLVRAVTAATEQITAIGKEIVELNNQLQSLRNQTVAPATPAKDLSDLKAKIEAWERKLLDANRYETVQEQIVAAEANRKSHAAAVADLERLVAYFGKDGVKAQIIKDSIDGFTEQVNVVLAVWGYSCELSVEPYRFIVTTAEGYTGPLKELSGSEKLMFGVALQSAIAIQSGIGLMVIDTIDTFIEEERDRMFAGVKSLLDDKVLEQAILLIADGRTEAPEVPGVAFYRVAGGKVERLIGQREEAAA